MIIKFPCGISQRAVGIEHWAICCDICDKWVHIGCNNLDNKTYLSLKHSDTAWYCISCLKKEIPFNVLDDKDLEKVYSGKHIVPFTKNKIEKFTEKVNKFLNEVAENEINCSYLDVEELNLKTASKLNKSFSVFHLNISSLPYHFDELEELLKQINLKFA